MQLPTRLLYEHLMSMNEDDAAPATFDSRS
jgi:hypothetical protein